jgi:hypothetical protein
MLRFMQYSNTYARKRSCRAAVQGTGNKRIVEKEREERKLSGCKLRERQREGEKKQSSAFRILRRCNPRQPAPFVPTLMTIMDQPTPSTTILIDGASTASSAFSVL